MFNSSLNGMTSIENNVGQSTISFLRDVAYAYLRVNECRRSSVYEPRRSKIGSSEAIVGECKYYQFNVELVT